MKRRGRPKGSKDTKPRKTRGKQAHKTSMFTDTTPGGQWGGHFNPPESTGNGGVQQHIDSCFFADTYAQDIEQGETFVEHFVQFTVGEALKSDDAPKWISAINKEHTKLKMFGTWRALDDSEFHQAKNPVPVALILTRKRDLTYKARAVCLGNLYKPDGQLDVYASVISQSANRYMLIDAAAAGDYLRIFDIDNAFVQSLIDSEVFIRLPAQWRTDNRDTGIRKLVKALYGLPQAPRLWAKCYERTLVELGWIQSVTRGLWKKLSMKRQDRFMRLGVFVDDNTASGPDAEEVDEEINRILLKFPGKFIDPELMPGGWLRFDLLGTDVWYHRGLKQLQVTMERYIEKTMEKFRMQGAKPADSPCFDEALLYDTASPKQDYPLREVIGCLSWAANICRIDICHPVNILARITCKEPTKAIVSCCKKVLRYLLGKPKIGLFYSPENEHEFNKTYGSLLPEGERPRDWNTFSDASFASCFLTMKSVSGSVVYYKSCPIAWKSARQTIRTNSTFESEYVAASDTIAVEESVDFKGFLGDEPDSYLWIDNQTAVTVSKTKCGKERPKSRHVALRYLRVSEVSDKIRFCPTHHEKADVLTKSNVSQDIRDHVFYHNPAMTSRKKQRELEKEDDVESMFVSSDGPICCFNSILEYFEC